MANKGRPRAFDRGLALNSAMYAFWRNGFPGTSINDLCEAMGIRSPSLYAAFDSKEALYLEAVHHYTDTIAPSVWNHLLSAGSARDCFENLLLAAAEMMPAHGEKPAGCMVTLAALDGESPDAISNRPREIRLRCLEMMRVRLDEASAAGELSGAIDSGHLSRFYFGVYQGLAMQARDGATAAELEGMVRTAMAAWPREKAVRTRKSAPT